MTSSHDTLSQGNPNEDVTSTAPEQTHAARERAIQQAFQQRQEYEQAVVEAANRAARNRGLNSAAVPTPKASGKAPKAKATRKGK